MFKQKFGVSDAMTGYMAGGKTDPLIVNELVQRHLDRDATALEIQEVIAAYLPLLKIELANSPEFKIMDWAIECIDWLEKRDDAFLCLATGNMRQAAKHKLDVISLWRKFADGGFADDSGDRRELVKAGKARGLALFPDCRQTVIVGDTPRDIDAARAADSLVIAVTTGSFTRDELLSADYVIDSLRELPEIHRALVG